MLFRQSHNNLTRFLMSNQLPYHVVDKINQRKDNPTILDRARTAYLGDAPNFLSPKKYGHRKHNHDPFTNFVVGYQMGGVPGIQAMFLHDLEDMISDDLAQKFGTGGRNIIEAFMNYSFSQHRKLNRNRRSYVKRPRRY